MALGVAARETPLHAQHAALGAHFTEFAGWSMPVHYGSIRTEHLAVRQAAGLFDLSHMGELWVRGRDAEAGLAFALVNDVSRLDPGRAQYSMLCTESGGIVDDLVVYRTANDAFQVVANASNVEVVRSLLRDRLAGFAVLLHDASPTTALLALQGPASLAILTQLLDVGVGGLRNYASMPGRVAGRPALVARTGYTGEDGFELYLADADAEHVWSALLERGAPLGLIPAGLGARDTLRLEAGMPLYGHELSREITPFEAGLGRVVRVDTVRPFVGREALAAAAQLPARRQLVGLEVTGRSIARQDTVVRATGGDTVGAVTSGTLSPTLDRSIAMAYVPPALAAPGNAVEVVIRDQPVVARVVPLPFYRRPH
jgi:aminomethyltransferase